MDGMVRGVNGESGAVEKHGVGASGVYYVDIDAETRSQVELYIADGTVITLCGGRHARRAGEGFGGPIFYTRKTRYKIYKIYII